jgi:energy-coupling factor transporter ATP-binding protein EcfA2
MTDWARKIAEGDARALARAATGIENRDPRALEVLRELQPRAGHAVVVGITGPPGAGKSTLVDAMARELRRQGRTAGIIAVDPSSRRTGGAILGDRIRMLDHHADPGVFIRSMATRGTSGGLAQATADMATLLDAAGKDFVIIETVGVGQDEVEIARCGAGDGGGAGARNGRRCTGYQGGHHGDRGYLRDQQIRPARSRADGAGDSKRAKPVARRTQTGHLSFAPSPPMEPASPELLQAISSPASPHLARVAAHSQGGHKLQVQK